MPPPPSSNRNPPPSSSSSRPGDVPAGIRIAGAASRAASASALAGPTPSPRDTPGKESNKPPVKLDREPHTAYGHRLPPKTAPAPAQGEVGKKPVVLRNSSSVKDTVRAGNQRPQAPQHRSSSGTSTCSAQPPAPAPATATAVGDDDEEEEGAIDDNSSAQPAQQAGGASGFGSGFNPPPPKTPLHPSQTPSAASNDRHRRRDQHQSYQPRSASPPKSQPPPAPSSSAAASYYPRSPSPPRSSRDSYPAQDSRYSRDDHRAGGGVNGNLPSRTNHPRDHERSRRRDRAEDGWDAESNRGWSSSDWRSGDRDRGWDRSDPRSDRERQWHRDHRDRHSYNRNGWEREASPPSTTTRPEQRYAGWSPTPPHTKSSTSHQSTADPAAPHSNGNADQRPPSRMGRTEPLPPLIAEQGGGGVKRPRSPSGARGNSPPAGLLKRKPNFSAIVPPTLLSPGKEMEKPIEDKDNVAPGAPLPHPPAASSTIQSPVLPLRMGSELAGTTSTLSTTAVQSADSNYQLMCEALDDVDCPSVRLSCLPRKPSSTSTSSDEKIMSGRERRKNRPAPTPLNQRKFIGCSSLDDYEISIKLGQGTFGEVLKGRQILAGTQVALKKVTIHDAKDGLPITALREIKLLKKLKHPSIVPVIDMAYRPSGERGKLGDVYMVEPYMDHDLNGMLENPSIRLEHSQIKLYMKQLLEGTLYLHKNRILHRDMKAANLLINNSGQLQIADFGLARPYRDPGKSWTGKGWQGGMQKYTNMVVTRWYRPPELLAGEKKYGPPIDMWGIGCILAEMIMGKPLFKGTSEINQLQLIAELCGSPNEYSFPGWRSLPGVKDADPTGRPDPHPEVKGQHDFGEYPRKVKDMFRNVYDAGPGCADLIDKLLVLDPKKRLTAQGALEHEWFWTKPWPADKATLPKYEHSKEIDRVRREWKPAPQPQQQVQQVQQQMPVQMGGARPIQGVGEVGMGMQARPPAFGRAYPNGAGGVGDAWDAQQQQHRPGIGGSAVPYPAPPQGQGRAYPTGPANPSNGACGGLGGAGRHAYPNQPQAGGGGGGGRFAHPNHQHQQARHGYSSHQQHQQQGQGQRMHPRSTLPARPPVPNPGAGAPSGPRGQNNGGGGNPYSSF
ncbi:related to cyclin dependent kinase C [Ustilago sp. UG-2017b]|nr:related to cyclin dependent kinase C [Ustilago sp. UG-2017b]